MAEVVIEVEKHSDGTLLVLRLTRPDRDTTAPRAAFAEKGSRLAVKRRESSAYLAEGSPRGWSSGIDALTHAS